jgi:hypothetical protein
MQSTCTAVPIRPGKVDSWKRFIAELNGPRRAEHEASRRRMGIRRESAWLQENPPMVIVQLDVDDPERASRELAESSDPFDRWFREQVLDIHGLDFRQVSGVPPNQPMLDYREAKTRGAV